MIECHYCTDEATLVGGDVIYPHRNDLADRNFWSCNNCDAYVGCHPRTAKPLGTLANKELRSWRSKAHRVFDPLWKSKTMTRTEAYRLLAEHMKLTPNQTHIGRFNVEQCKEAISFGRKQDGNSN